MLVNALRPKLFSCETERLRLRPLAASDEALFHALYTDPETMRFIAPPLTAEEASSRFRKVIRQQGEPALGARYVVIEGKTTQLPMGICGTGHYDQAVRRLEVGMVLLLEGRKRGFAREALAALVGLAFDEPWVSEVYARFAAGHTAAANLVERVGLRSNHATRGEGEGMAMCEWSVLRSAWRISRTSNNRGNQCPT